MRIHHLGIGSVFAILLAAVLVCRVPDPPRREATAPSQAPRAHASLPSASPFPTATNPRPSAAPPATVSNEEIGLADEELDEDAAIESALLTLIRARGRGTHARR